MRKIKLFTAVAFISLITCFTSFAGEWKQDTTGWWYQNDDGSYPTNQWQDINGKQYYFGSDGYMLVNTTTPDGYLVGADGVWLPAQETPKFDFSIDTCSVKYTNHKVMTADYDGYTCLALYFDYTNKSSEAEAAWLADYSITVFQNGIECDTTFLSYDDREDSFDNYTKEVLPNTTINVAKAYRIKDMSDVTIQIKETWNWENPKKDTVTLVLH